MSEKVSGGVVVEIERVKLQVIYEWDCFGDEVDGYDEVDEYWVYLATDVRQEDDIYDLLTAEAHDKIYNAIEEDARSKGYGK